MYCHVVNHFSSFAEFLKNATDAHLNHTITNLKGTTWSNNVLKVLTMEWTDTNETELECRGYCYFHETQCEFAFLHPNTNECVLGRFNSNSPPATIPPVVDVDVWTQLGTD